MLTAKFPTKRVMGDLSGRMGTSVQMPHQKIVNCEPSGWGYRLHLDNGQSWMVPRVTSVLDKINKPFLTKWKIDKAVQEMADCGADAFRLLHKDPTATVADFALKVGQLRSEHGRDVEMAEKYADYGTRVHGWIERYWQGVILGEDASLPVEPDIADTIELFMAWTREHDVRPLSLESIVYSGYYGYAGRRDMLAEVDGKLTIVDWKTSKDVYFEHVLQNCAYRYAHSEMCGEDEVEQGMVVTIPREPGLAMSTHVVTSDDYYEGFPVFLGLLLVYYAGKEWEKGHGAGKKKTAGKGVSDA